jgi:hypothetical protein
LRGTLNAASRSPAKARMPASSAVSPSRRTTAAATSSPSFGMWQREGHDLRDGRMRRQDTVDLQRETFSPPRLMISFSRPVSVR